MKKYFFLLVVIIGIVACNKTKSDDNAILEGTWRMISVQDKGGINPILNPGNMGDVIITFSSGKLSGTTPSNDIWPSNYIIGPGNQLSVPAIGGTKVGENAWGRLFYINMYTIESYFFKKSNQLFINTKDKVLGFERR